MRARQVLSEIFVQTDELSILAFVHVLKDAGIAPVQLQHSVSCALPHAVLSPSVWRAPRPQLSPSHLGVSDVTSSHPSSSSSPNTSFMDAMERFSATW